jgi:hypothetical protein
MEEELPTRFPEVQRHLEIVGLHSSSNGRSCFVHSCCGDFLKVEDLLRLQKCVVTINGQINDAIKRVRIIDGTDSCTAAFVPRSMVKSIKIETNLDTFVQVLELYDNSENSHKRRKSHQNKGMAGCIFLVAIPEAI